MANFNFVGNRVFDDRYSAFAPQGKQRRPGSAMFDPDFLDTGVVVKD